MRERDREKARDDMRGSREEGGVVKWRSESGLPGSFLGDNNKGYLLAWLVVS
ncbi:hypothetical protein HanRHA438_Chr10g0447511 [Helianthus annuus]|nr:hypothetical protein HanRHA438_Chr10g0447511 [Helianthus annuus]